MPLDPGSFCGGLIEQMRKPAQRQRIALGSNPAITPSARSET